MNPVSSDVVVKFCAAGKEVATFLWAEDLPAYDPAVLLSIGIHIKQRKPNPLGGFDQGGHRYNEIKTAKT